MTDCYLPSGERDNERRPYVVAHPKKLLPLTWEKAVERLSHPTYWVNARKFGRGQASANTDFLTTINRANPVVADPDNVQAGRDTSETVEGATAAAHESYPVSGHSPASSLIRGAAPRHLRLDRGSEAHGQLLRCGGKCSCRRHS